MMSFLEEIGKKIRRVDGRGDRWPDPRSRIKKEGSSFTKATIPPSGGCSPP